MLAALDLLSVGVVAVTMLYLIARDADRLVARSRAVLTPPWPASGRGLQEK